MMQNDKNGKNARRRGSVLLMVIGLLTILAMLGSTFLFVARSDRKSSEALTYRYQATPLASGTLTRVKELLKQDLWIDANGPYGNTSATAADAWRQFIDYPATGTDDWLANIDPYDAGGGVWTWRHVTNLFNPEAAFLNPPSLQTSNPNNLLVDSDGDGIPDAYYGAGSGGNFEANVMNDRGEKYYVSARVIDLGGLININTAGESSTTEITTPISTVNINLDGLLSSVATAYPNIKSSRQNAETLNNYNTMCAQRVLTPFGASYNSFAIGDEMFLRWLGNEGLTFQGRVYGLTKDGINPLPAGYRKYLTTYNASRSILRHPISPTDAKLYLTNSPTVPPAAPVIPNDSSLQLDNSTTSTTLDELYDRVKLYFNSLGILANPNQKAACFVANYQLYRNRLNDVTFTDPYSTVSGYKYTNAADGVTGYVMWEQPYIVETYAYSGPKFQETVATGDKNGDSVIGLIEGAWGFAIEVYLPYYPGTYTFDIRVNSTKLIPTVSTDTQLNNGQRMVYYDYGGYKPDGTLAVETDFGFNPATDKKISGLDFSGGAGVNRISLVRDIQNAGTEFIYLDSVIGTDFGYSSANKDVPNGDAVITGRGARDDNDLRRRMGVAVYTQGVTGAIYGPNSLAIDEAEITDIAQNQQPTAVSALWGIPQIMAICPYTAFENRCKRGNIGELSLMWIIGPSANLGEDTPNIIKNDFPDSPGKGLLECVPTNTLQIYSMGNGGWGTLPNTYPDVPIGTLLGEFFDFVKTDNTRTDDTRRLYGKLNINTASFWTFAYLPWTAGLTPAAGNNYNITIGTQTRTVNIWELAAHIVAYRDKLNTSDFVGAGSGTGSYASIANNTNLQRDYSTSRAGTAGSNIAELRQQSQGRGFLTPGEIAIPIADYINTLFGWIDYATDPPIDFINSVNLGLAAGNYADYIQAKDVLYRSVSNLVTVNSDVYAVYIYVKANPAGVGGTVAATAGHEWRYIAILDRSNCRAATDTPAVLMFTELK